MPAITPEFVDVALGAAEQDQRDAVLQIFLAADEPTKLTAFSDFFFALGEENALRSVKLQLLSP